MHKIISRFVGSVFLPLFSLLIISACASKRLAPQPIPNWFINMQSDEMTFYGKGSDERSQDKAIKIALTDIASQLSVSINSTTTSKQQLVSTENHSSNFSDDRIEIGAKVEALNFKGYSTEKSERVGGIHYVLVSVNKMELLKNQKNNLKALDDDIDLSYQTIKESSLVQAIQSGKAFDTQIQKARSLATIISSIDRQFDLLQTQKRYNQLTRQVQGKRSELSIYIASGSPHEIQVILGKQMNQEHITLVNNKKNFKKNTHIIEMSMIVENNLAFDNYMTKIQIRLSLKEQSGNIVASNKFEVSGSSLSNFEKSKQSAINQFTKRINKLNFLETLGIL